MTEFAVSIKALRDISQIGLQDLLDYTSSRLRAAGGSYLVLRDLMPEEERRAFRECLRGELINGMMIYTAAAVRNPHSITPPPAFRKIFPVCFGDVEGELDMWMLEVAVEGGEGLRDAKLSLYREAWWQPGAERVFPNLNGLIQMWRQQSAYLPPHLPGTPSTRLVLRELGISALREARSLVKSSLDLIEQDLEENRNAIQRVKRTLEEYEQEQDHLGQIEKNSLLRAFLSTCLEKPSLGGDTYHTFCVHQRTANRIIAAAARAKGLDLTPARKAAMFKVVDYEAVRLWTTYMKCLLLHSESRNPVQPCNPVLARLINIMETGDWSLERLFDGTVYEAFGRPPYQLDSDVEWGKMLASSDFERDDDDSGSYPPPAEIPSSAADLDDARYLLSKRLEFMEGTLNEWTSTEEWVTEALRVTDKIDGRWNSEWRAME
ncbi:hypothetical protein CC1G_12886 [Coprinopsis cinerea okayama7|uniref:Uncharacterized protein n=2 Tax=Coprinopsis cinerea (strain Okayama-7 / 130 / ATCC MYA-4618 / FGSC 9003) TaxID=240176 RepID=A8PHV5_COPC7|nr:hypothetical protein CC1G_12886 [Coprinopsis cinerea okayama7\|eukprot:XP_001841471.2 hypothetical protein CC1G_12886 [Coprinopsis cinerea okayama7\